MTTSTTDVQHVNLSNLTACVSARGDLIAMLRNPGDMTRDDALVVAAWLVALADPGGERFNAILERVLMI
jgi:hypothetical protein